MRAALPCLILLCACGPTTGNPGDGDGNDDAGDGPDATAWPDAGDFPDAAPDTPCGNAAADKSSVGCDYHAVALAAYGGAFGWGSPETRAGEQYPCVLGEPDNSCDVSYAYPAGENVAPINDVIIVP